MRGAATEQVVSESDGIQMTLHLFSLWQVAAAEEEMEHEMEAANTAAFLSNFTGAFRKLKDVTCGSRGLFRLESSFPLACVVHAHVWVEACYYSVDHDRILFTSL